MTPATFARTYGALADAAAAKLGIHAETILAQWAVETGWGTSALCLNHRNLAGIRWYGKAGTYQVGGTPGVRGTGFSSYVSLGSFVGDYVATLGLSYYDRVRAAGDIEAELIALGESPWDAGHYLSGGVVGGSILAAWRTMYPAPVPIEVAPMQTFTITPSAVVGSLAVTTDGHSYVRLVDGSLHGPIPVPWHKPVAFGPVKLAVPIAGGAPGADRVTGYIVGDEAAFLLASDVTFTPATGDTAAAAQAAHDQTKAAALAAIEAL